MSECLICYNYIESRIFGFEHCYKSHVFCEECMVELIKKETCPLDRIHYDFVIISNNENDSVPLKKWTLRVNELLSILSDKRKMLTKKEIPEDQFSLDMCTNCMDDIKDEIQFGLECCFQDHRLCYYCFLLYMYDIFLDVTKCFQDGKINTTLNIVAQRNGEIAFLKQDRYKEIEKEIGEYVNVNGEEEIEDALWRMIKETNQLSLDICRCCSVDIKDKIQMELECCFQDHRQCSFCFYFYLFSDFTKCRRHSLKFNSLKINAQRKSEVVTLKNSNFENSYQIFQNNYASVAGNDVSTFGETLWRLITNSFSLDKCLTCALDIKNNIQIELEGCFEHHRLCFNCFSLNMIKSTFNVTKCCVGIYKQDDSLNTVVQRNGEIVHLSKERVETIVLKLSAYKDYAYAIGHDESTFQDTLWRIIKNGTFE